MEKNSLCVAVKSNVSKVNNEYSDSAIDKTCKYQVRMICNNFVSVDSLLSIYNKNMHQLLINLLSTRKQLKEIIELKHLFTYADFVANNTKMTQICFQAELLFLVWNHPKLAIKMEANRKCKKTYIKFGNIRKGM